MALDPELLKRRQRIKMPRAPPRTLGAKGTPKEADEKLEKLLEELLAEAKKETLFTTTLERDRLASALSYGGYLFSIIINVENQLAPGATATTYTLVPGGWVYIPVGSSYYASLPWWLTVAIWADSDLPALPAVFLIRAPDKYTEDWTGITPIKRHIRHTVTNNHATDIANFLAINGFYAVTEATWRMLEIVYLQPIVDYVRGKAEELSGRPFP